MPRNSSEWNKKQNHSEIEKRRRDKMNTYIMELSSIIPVGTSRKLDKLTVLRMAVQHMRMLRGSLNSYTEGHYKPAFLSDHELKNLILQAADGFLFVVGCDGGRILYVSESVSQTLQYSRAELLDTSWFDILHPKDLTKVKEQLSSADINRRDRLVDAKTLLPVKADMPQGLSKLCPGFRRSFFCRMRCKFTNVIKEEADTTTGCHKKKSKRQHCSDKKYTVIHFTGYLKSWATSSDSVEDENEGDEESCNLSCLVAVGRVHQPLLSSLSQDSARLRRFLSSQSIEYVTKHTNDGKFVFIDQKASLLLGWLPQELLGTSMYEYYHPDDISALSETHKQVLQTNELRYTQVYRFRTKDASFLHLKSVWKTFKNPWTKDIEYIIATNSLVLSEGEVESTMVSDCVSSQSYSNLSEFINSPGGGSCSSVSSSRIVGNGIQSNKIGRQIAMEVLDSGRRSDSPINESLSSIDSILASNSNGGDFNTLIKNCGDNNKINVCESSSDVAAHSDSILNSQSSGLLVDQLPQAEPAFSAPNAPNSGVQQVSNNSEILEAVGGNELESEVTSDSDEAAMAVIMSLLEADAGLGEPVDFSHLPWPLP